MTGMTGIISWWSKSWDWRHRGLVESLYFLTNTEAPFVFSPRRDAALRVSSDTAEVLLKQIGIAETRWRRLRFEPVGPVQPAVKTAETDIAAVDWSF